MESSIKQKTTILLRLNFEGFMETDPWMVTFWVNSKGLERQALNGAEGKK